MRCFGVGVLLLLMACRPGTEEDVPTSVPATMPRVVEFSGEYWQQQADENTPVWKRAFARCQKPEGRHDPQCAVVLYTALIRSLEEAAQTPFPEYPGAGDPPIASGADSSVSTSKKTDGEPDR